MKRNAFNSICKEKDVVKSKKRLKIMEVDIYENMLIKNIKHGKGYSSCDYYPECNEMFAPGRIKINVENREIIEHIESRNPCYRARYAHYAKREVLNLRAERNYKKESVIEWIKDNNSDF